MKILASENGEGKTHHGENMYESRDTHNTWIDIFTGEKKLDQKLAYQLLGEDDSIYALTDTPFAAYWKELHEAYPNAKVVLLKHPGGCTAQIQSSKVFISSFRALIQQLNIAFCRPLSMLVYFTATWHAVNAEKGGWEMYLTFMNMFSEDELLISLTYTHYNIRKKNYALKKEDIQSVYEDVRRTIPKDQLLEFSVKDGWDPLCKFLGVSVPDISFPKMDNHSTIEVKFFHAMLRVAMFVSIIIVLADIYVVVTVLLGYTACKWPVLILSIAILFVLQLKEAVTLDNV